MGTAAEYRMTKERREILEVLREADGPMRPKEIAEALGKKYEVVAKTLQRMSKSGEVKKDTYGKYIYCLSSLSSPSSPSCPSVQVDEKWELGQGLGQGYGPQTRMNRELGQVGQVGQVDWGDDIDSINI